LSRRAVSAGLSLVLAMALVVASQTAASSLDPWHEPPPLELSAAQVSSDACPWVGSVVRTQKFTAEQTGSTAFGHTWTHVVGHATAPVAGQTCGTSWRTWDKDTGWEVDTTDPDCTRTRNYAGEGFTAGSGELELSIGGGVGGIWHARVVALGGEYEYSGSETRTNCGETTTFPLTPMQFADISDDECARIQVPSATVQAFRYTCQRDRAGVPLHLRPGLPSRAGRDGRRHIHVEVPSCHRRLVPPGSVRHISRHRRGRCERLRRVRRGYRPACRRG
jgi:hypothetical protein